MTKKDFIKVIAERTENTQKDVAVIVDTALETIVEAVAAGEKVSFVGFGTFETVERSEREGRNPKTGEAMIIEACKSPKFKAGKNFKDSVKNA
jgi:DNA-binding protein HU-beta